MNQDRTKRKLTAILSADVVGYSRLMEEDEDWTIKTLEENKKLISEFIEEYKGRVVDAPGDNILAEFSSVTNAVECAVKIQKELNKKNSKFMEDHRMHFRIGVNLGDVVEEDGRIYGNGVNIAARLEGLAQPGGISISRNVYDQVKTKLDLGYEYLGEYNVKNIIEPVRVYCVLLDSETAGKGIENKEFSQPITTVEYRVGLRTMLLWAASAFVLIAIAGVIGWNMKPTPPPEKKQVAYFQHELSKDQQFGELFERALAISPDGSQLVFKTEKGLYLHSIDKPEMDAKLIPRTAENPQRPFFSPDGKWVGYISGADRKLKKISIKGGTPVPLADDINSLGSLSWGTDETIVYAGGGGIARIPAKGGKPKMLIKEEKGMYIAPQILPDNKSVLFTLGPRPYKIMVYSLESRELKELIDGDTARYIPTGQIVYAVDDDLFAVPFNLDLLEITGGKIPLLTGIYRQTAAPQYDVSDSGTLVYIPGTATISETQRTLVWVDKKGNEESIEAPPDSYLLPKISIDGTQVALSITRDGNDDIYIRDLVRKTLSRLTTDESSDFQPIWTPDDRKIVFSSGSGSNIGGLYWMDARGTGKAEQLLSVPGRVIFPGSWSSDGNTLVLWEVDQATRKHDIGILSMKGKRVRSTLLQEKYNETNPQISPNGRWMAYESDETGQMEIYIRSFPDVENFKRKVSTEGGNSPLWSPDGRELFYRNGDVTMAVQVETEPTFNFKTPVILFKGNYLSFPVRLLERTCWDIGKDGRFLMIKPPATTDDGSNDESASGIPHKINIILNWFEALKEQVAND